MTTADPPSSMGSAERRIEHATDEIRSMSQDLADEVAPRPSWIDQMRALTREAPIHSLAIAFLLGLIVTRW
ncbi:hypothetical protein JQ597_12890 [Bradyrhizobium sp. AUGA SZCCT0177]|uniref:hypothetical protein n=1 Tax=Bradyrhizobium sp. AUGA SZCCT0177 TaxID=2807665 RepID=UPI001BA60C72|nr:hypothetical protein [Bradyrhizobium sp. AUGA SZCCT0177]MBR1282938.1 hypothetical protein [Bradyrhizobium sp. AUGA SZCCT0177]